VHLLLLVEQPGAEPLCLGDSFHLDGNRIHGLLQLVEALIELKYVR